MRDENDDYFNYRIPFGEKEKNVFEFPSICSNSAENQKEVYKCNSYQFYHFEITRASLVEAL